MPYQTLSKDRAVRKVERAIDAIAALQDGGHGCYETDVILVHLNKLRFLIEHK